MAKRSKSSARSAGAGAIRLDLGAAPGVWSQYAPRRLGRGGWVVGTFDRILARIGLDMAARVLKGGSDALIKVFRGAGFQELVKDARGCFAKVKLVKPAASRSRSPEMYLLAKDFRLV